AEIRRYGMNNSSPSKSKVGYRSQGSSLKLVKLCAITSVSILWTASGMAAEPVTSNYELKPLSLPGATGVVTLDYFAYDRSTGRLWVPASNTGSVDVIDEATDAVSQVTGFQTGEVELRGRKIKLGPTADRKSVGEGR